MDFELRPERLRTLLFFIVVTPCFSRNDTGKYLCYAKGKEVVMLETENWTSYLTLTDDKVSGNYSVCGLSACGKYVAAGTTKGELSVWRVTEQKWKRVDGKTCAEDGTNEPITSLQWNVSGTPQFVFADKSGQLGCVNIEGAEAAGKSLLPEADDVLYDDCEEHKKSLEAIESLTLTF